jgi:anti-sigma factor RsiW
MNDSAYQRLKEKSWHKKLDPAEDRALQAYLEAHPQARLEWEKETVLTDLLAGLPDAPLSSNFTARVVQAAGREQQRAEAVRRRLTWQSVIRLLPRSAMALVVVGIGFLSFHQYQQNTRSQIARSVVAVSAVATLPRMEWLQDFEAINRLNQVTPMDDELLALLK